MMCFRGVSGRRTDALALETGWVSCARSICRGTSHPYTSHMNYLRAYGQECLRCCTGFYVHNTRFPALNIGHHFGLRICVPTMHYTLRGDCPVLNKTLRDGTR